MKKVNSLSEEIKKLKELPPRKKLEFIWDYYKWPILITLFIIISVIATAISLANEKQVVLSGYLLDSFYTTEHDEPFADFIDYAQHDATQEKANFITNMSLYGEQAEASQQFYATIAAGHTDFAVSKPESFLRLSYDCFDYFYDLREILTPQQLEQLSDRLFYVDASMLDKLNGQGTIILPDHDKPETMKDPVPIGIDIRGCRGVDPLYLGDEPVYFAVASNAPHMDMVYSFIDYLFSESN